MRHALRSDSTYAARLAAAVAAAIQTPAFPTDAASCKLHFLRRCTALPLYGATFFAVRHEAQPCTLALTMAGVSLLHTTVSEQTSTFSTPGEIPMCVVRLRLARCGGGIRAVRRLK